MSAIEDRRRERAEAARQMLDRRGFDVPTLEAHTVWTLLGKRLADHAPWRLYLVCRETRLCAVDGALTHLGNYVVEQEARR